MEYLKKTFSVPLGSDAYQKNWDAVFGKARKAALDEAKRHCERCGLIGGEHADPCITEEEPAGG